MSEQLTEELLSKTETFLVKLRLGDGLDPKAYIEVCNTLKACVIEWRSSDFIPKKIANILVDLYPAIEACSYLYADPEAENVRKASDEIADLTRQIVAD